MFMKYQINDEIFYEYKIIFIRNFVNKILITYCENWSCHFYQNNLQINLFNYRIPINNKNR